MCDIETLRLFINERLSAVAEDILSVFVRTLVDYQRQLDVLHPPPPVKTQPADFFPVCEEEVSPERQERSDREEAYGSTLTLPAVKREDGDESIETEPVASTSTQHMTTQADVKDRGTSQPTGDVQVLSSLSSESDTELTEDSDEWEETKGDRSALKTLTSHRTQHVEGQSLSLRNELPQDLESSEQTLASSHAGEKSFNLTFSDKRFNQNRHLKSHIGIDTGRPNERKLRRAAVNAHTEEPERGPPTPASARLAKKRKRCRSCPAKTDRKTSTTCRSCDKYICKEHTQTLAYCCSCMQQSNVWLL